MTDWLAAVQNLRDDGRPGVLATVVSVRGHAPREAGAKMVIAADALWDSIGGGNLEAEVIDRARRMIAEASGAPEDFDVCAQRARGEPARTPVLRRRGAGPAGTAAQ